MDDYKAQRYIKQQLRIAGQNERRIIFNIHKWGLQFDGGIVSNSGNPQLVWNLLGKSQHHSAKKHCMELQKRGIKEFEISIANIGILTLGVNEIVNYVKIRRANKLSLKYVPANTGRFI
jgi:hypothetical protein